MQLTGERGKDRQVRVETVREVALLYYYAARAWMVGLLFRLQCFVVALVIPRRRIEKDRCFYCSFLGFFLLLRTDWIDSVNWDLKIRTNTSTLCPAISFHFYFEVASTAYKVYDLSVCRSHRTTWFCRNPNNTSKYGLFTATLAL